MTISQVLNQSFLILKKTGILTPQLDSEVLLSHVLNKPKEFLYAHSDKLIKEEKVELFFNLIKKRAKFEPIAYLVGNKDFYGLNFKVKKGVLIPRPETELLIDEVLGYARKIRPEGQNLTLADVGTGSGIIGITLKKYLPRAKILALDISPEAVQIAKNNAKTHKVKLEFYNGNLLAPVKNKKIDIIAANLPYVDDKEKNFHKNKNKEIHRKTLAYEPKIAIYSGRFGLESYNKLFSQINKLEYKPKIVFCEIGHQYIAETKKLVKQYFPDADFEIKKDLAGLNRLLIVKLT